MLSFFPLVTLSLHSRARAYHLSSSDDDEDDGGGEEEGSDDIDSRDDGGMKLRTCRCEWEMQGSNGIGSRTSWCGVDRQGQPMSFWKGSLPPQGLYGTYDNTVKWTSEAGKLKPDSQMETFAERVLQERERSQRLSKHEKYLLDEAIKALTKELDKNGSWLVQFVDREKLDKHPDHSWPVHQFTSNVPVTALADNDNDRLYQVLNILEMLNDKEKARYLEEKQLQILLCEYILEVFHFLAAPLDVQVLNLVMKEDEEEDVAKRRRQVAHDMIHEAKDASTFAWDIINEFTKKCLGIWLKGLGTN
ncbi:hypothetical protein EDD15DRAFT_2197820 [Pisolithus albus]|nr:hypothetical protein EDD15DRAFT_2197820 [Pisolithus albus]